MMNHGKLAFVIAGWLFTADSAFPLDLGSLIENAGTRRVEFASDLLLPIMPSSNVSGSISITYLKQLYVRADSARHSYPEIRAALAAPGKMSQFFPFLTQLEVDSLSIKLKVLRRLHKLDPSAARSLAASLRLSYPNPTEGCAATSIAYSGGYFETFAEYLPDLWNTAVENAALPQDIVGLLKALDAHSELPLSKVHRGMAKAVEVLQAVRVSDRVFTTTEVNLGLGERVEGLANKERIPVSLRKALVQSWLQYVARQASSRTRCADIVRGANHDYFETLVLPRAKRLMASPYGAGSVSLTPSPVSQGEGAQAFQPTAFLNDITSLFRSASEVLSSKTPSALEAYRRNLRSFIAQYRDKPLSVYENSQQIASYVGLAAMVADDESRRNIVPELFATLERPALKAAEPSAWILSVHDTLNLTLHPDSVLARMVDMRFRDTSDPDLKAYYLMNRTFSYVQSYQKHFSVPSSWPAIGELSVWRASR